MDDRIETSGEAGIDRLKAPADYAGVLAGALLLMAGAWGGLYVLILSRRPFVGERWLFFVLLFAAAAASAMPFVRYLNLRFTPIHRTLPPGGVLIRQSVWVGLFIVTCAWLQIPRALTLPTAFFLGVAFLVIEIFLRTREIPGERW